MEGQGYLACKGHDRGAVHPATYPNAWRRANAGLPEMAKRALPAATLCSPEFQNVGEGVPMPRKTTWVKHRWRSYMTAEETAIYVLHEKKQVELAREILAAKSVKDEIEARARARVLIGQRGKE